MSIRLVRLFRSELLTRFHLTKSGDSGEIIPPERLRRKYKIHYITSFPRMQIERIQRKAGWFGPHSTQRHVPFGRCMSERDVYVCPRYLANVEALTLFLDRWEVDLLSPAKPPQEIEDTTTLTRMRILCRRGSAGGLA